MPDASSACLLTYQFSPYIAAFLIASFRTQPKQHIDFYVNFDQLVRECEFFNSR